MKTCLKQLAMMYLSGNIFSAQASNELQLDRSLQQSGPNCRVSASVKCIVTETGQLCQKIGQQPFGTCGPKEMVFTYEFCNLNSDANVLPVKTAPASGLEGTQAMFRQRKGFPELNISSMGPTVCRTKKVTEIVDTCKKRVVGSIRFEGWVDGFVDVPGYYCYAYDFLDVQFRSSTGPGNPPPTPSPTKAAVADISLEVKCFYTKNGQKYNCESLTFTQLNYLSCTIPVTYVYTIVNMSHGKVFLDALLGVDSLPLNVEGMDLGAYESKVVEIPGDINVCDVSGTTVTKRALAFATPVTGGITDEARDNLQIDVPLIPFRVVLEGIGCVVPNAGGQDCITYLNTITHPEQCRNNVEFRYTVTNVGMGCADISFVSSRLGPKGLRTLAFEDFYPCGTDRNFCSGDSWTIPDRRTIDFCTETQAPRQWTIDLEIGDELGREQETAVNYFWPEFSLPVKPPAPAPYPNHGPTKGKTKRS